MPYAAYIDAAYYSGTYNGKAIDSSSFDRLALRASDELDKLTFGRVRRVGLSSYDDDVQEAVKLAVCAFTRMAGQSFTATYGGMLSSITVAATKQGSPTDSIIGKIYTSNAGVPDELLYTSTNSILGSSLPTTASIGSHTFTFSNAALNRNTQYVFVIERTGDLSGTDFYGFWYYVPNTYSCGTMVSTNNGVTWTVYGNADLRINIYIAAPNQAVVVWNAVTATEAFKYAAIIADQTGAIVWYLSDDGTNWAEITNLDTMQAVNFDAASVYLKCVLTSGEVRAVAWGGN